MHADRELHHFLTEKNRFRIIQIILEHTNRLPTLYEITQFSPDCDRSDIEQYLAELIDAGVIREVTLPPDERTGGYPHTFYALTEDGIGFLVNHSLFDSESISMRWQDVDVDDPKKLAKHESAPRPDDVTTFQEVAVESTTGQHLEEYKLVTEQAEDALYMLDSDGRYVLVNEAYEELTGYDRTELLGSTPSKVLDEESMSKRRSIVVDLLNEDSDRESTTWTSRLETADGETIPVEVKLSTIQYQEEFVGIVGAARNIEKRQRRQQELMVLSRVLRHNLSNKVNVIKGYADVLDHKTDGNDGAEYIERIQRTADRLLQQSEKARDINDLLQGWPPETAPVELTELVWDVLTELEAEHPDARIETDLPDSTWGHIPDSFELAIEELVRNAIEHSEREEPTVRVRLVAPAEGDDVVLEVADDGPGIPDHEIEVHERGEESALHHSSGLGLWLVNWIVEAAGGDIEFTESDLGGSCVRVELAQADPPALTLSM